MASVFFASSPSPVAEEDEEELLETVSDGGRGTVSRPLDEDPPAASAPAEDCGTTTLGAEMGSLEGARN